MLLCIWFSRHALGTQDSHYVEIWCVQHAVKLLEMLVGVINAYLCLCCCIGEEVLNGNLCRSRATPKVSMSSAVHVC